MKHFEVAEMMRRIGWQYVKYLIRDPIFTRFTEPMLKKVLTKLWIPQIIICYQLAYVNYFRYYTFIA